MKHQTAHEIPLRHSTDQDTSHGTLRFAMEITGPDGYRLPTEELLQNDDYAYQLLEDLATFLKARIPMLALSDQATYSDGSTTLAKTVTVNNHDGLEFTIEIVCQLAKSISEEAKTHLASRLYSDFVVEVEYKTQKMLGNHEVEHGLEGLRILQDSLV